MRADNKNRISKCCLSYKLLKMPRCQGISGIAIVQIANLLLWHNGAKRDFLFKPSWRGVPIILTFKHSKRKIETIRKDKYYGWGVVRDNSVQFTTKHSIMHGCACKISLPYFACLSDYLILKRSKSVLSEFYRFGWRTHKVISDIFAGNFCAQGSPWAESTPANICGESMISGIDSQTDSPKCYKVFARASCNVFIACNCCVQFNNQKSKLRLKSAPVWFLQMSPCIACRG